MWNLFLHLSDGYLLGMGLWLLLLTAMPVYLVRKRRQWKESRSRIRVLYLGLSLWMCLVPLTLLEVGFALLYDTTDSFDMTNVSHRWFEVHVAPDVKQLVFSADDGQAYRSDTEFPLQPEDDRQHVVFFGDSFTFGHGVPDLSNRFTEQLSSQLQTSDDDAPARISNLSWPGTDLRWTEAMLQRVFAADGRVDRAVYVLCLNDIESFHDPRMQRSTELSTFEPPTFLFRDTYFFNWLYFRVQLLSRSDVRNYYDFVSDYYTGEPWRPFETALIRTQLMCQANDSELAVVIFPFMHVLGNDYPFRPVHQQLVRACEANGIPVIDLESDLSQHAAEGLTVNRFDAHPNERAHQLAAEAIRREWFGNAASLARQKGE